MYLNKYNENDKFSQSGSTNLTKGYLEVSSNNSSNNSKILNKNPETFMNESPNHDSSISIRDHLSFDTPFQHSDMEESVLNTSKSTISNTTTDSNDSFNCLFWNMSGYRLSRPHLDKFTQL